MIYAVYSQSNYTVYQYVHLIHASSQYIIFYPVFGWNVSQIFFILTLKHKRASFSVKHRCSSVCAVWLAVLVSVVRR